VAVTQIDIDEDALAEAIRLSGAKTKKDIVNLLALREFAARPTRRSRRVPGGGSNQRSIGSCATALTARCQPWICSICGSAPSTTSRRPADSYSSVCGTTAPMG
jgi:hypothetical protein